MNQITIKREIDAIQWLGPDHELPEGFHETMPEVHWSAARDLVYFTYGKLDSRDWIGVEKLTEKPGKSALEGWVGYTPPGHAPYWRKVLPFAFWSVKSESTIRVRNGDPTAYRAVFLNRDDAEQVRLFHDYCASQRWPNPLPRYAEYREIDGAYGRGYAPHYLAPGDWLLCERDARPRVVSDEEMQKLRA